MRAIVRRSRRMAHPILEMAAEVILEISGSLPAPIRAWIPVAVVALLVLGIVIAVSIWAG